MRRLSHVSELLDGPLDDPEALRGNLRDLRRMNRLTWGVTLSELGVNALLDGRRGRTLLDVGTGGADIPVALLADARRRGRALTVTATDRRPEVLDAARAIWPDLDRMPHLTLEIADGRALPYSDRTFDIAHASLVLHHHDPSDAVRFLRELGRVARVGIVVNDLGRSRVTLLGAWLLSRITTRNAFSRHDAPLSARRAYTSAEAVRLLAAAGLRPVYEARAPLGHRWVIAAVRR